MGITDPARTSPAADPRAGDAAYLYTHRGDTWVMFAGVLLVLAGTLNVIDGIAAIGNSAFFVDGARFILFSDLNTWGWVMSLLGAVQIVVAFGVWNRWTGVRWVGVGIAMVNAFAQILFMPAYPLWALSLFVMDVLVIYALVAYGGRHEA